MSAGQYLGSRQATGLIDNSGLNPFGLGFYTVSFDAKALAITSNLVEVYHIALKGPGGNFEVWTDSTFYDTNPRGDVNSWDPVNPLFLRGGQTLYFFWSQAGTPVPLVTIWLRQPLVA